MKKILLFLLLAVVLAPPVAWKLADDRTVEMVVVDASVADEKMETHAGITWLTEQMRIRRRGGFPYQLDTYYGFFPTRSESVVRFRAENLDGIDLLYLCDLRGVWRSGTESFEILRNPRRDDLLHSGLSIDEINAVVDHVQEGNTTVAEAFLFYARHEGGETSVRKLEEAFHVEWTGWIGASFMDLGNMLEVPFWVRTFYEREMVAHWDFDGPGIILMEPQLKKFVILKPEVELREPTPSLTVTRRDRALGDDVESGVPYFGWFEIVEADRVDEIRAMIQLAPTSLGEGVLRENLIPTAFPAVVAQWVDRHTWYLAADLGTVPTWLGPAQIGWMPEMRRTVSSFIGNYYPGEEAFWKFYIPFMRNLLNDLAY
jgi:hypothetical protein